MRAAVDRVHVWQLEAVPLVVLISEETEHTSTPALCQQHACLWIGEAWLHGKASKTIQTSCERQQRQQRHVKTCKRGQYAKTEERRAKTAKTTRSQRRAKRLQRLQRLQRCTRTAYKRSPCLLVGQGISISILRRPSSLPERIEGPAHFLEYGAQCRRVPYGTEHHVYQEARSSARQVF